MGKRLEKGRKEKDGEEKRAGWCPQGALGPPPNGPAPLSQPTPDLLQKELLVLPLPSEICQIWKRTIGSLGHSGQEGRQGVSSSASLSRELGAPLHLRGTRSRNSYPALMGPRKLGMGEDLRSA